MGRTELDAAYDNTAAVADSAAVLASFQARSDCLRTAQAEHLNLAYGPGERNRIDYFRAPAPGPVLVFIHGGYWQMRAKETFSFVAEGPLAHGIHVALVGYTLAPETTLGGIVAEIRAALGWVREHAPDFGGDPARIVVAGWSAGGHLAAMCLDEEGVVGGLAISGIFDLEPISLCYLNEKLHLTQAEIQELSPLRSPISARPLVLAYGERELPELQRQSEVFAAARDDAPGSLLPLPGHNHFTILTELAHAHGALTKQVRALLCACDVGSDRACDLPEKARMP